MTSDERWVEVSWSQHERGASALAGVDLIESLSEAAGR